MYSVALYLQKAAIGHGDPKEKDLFGRSAFNRYYYDLFINVRQTLQRLSNDWARAPHKSMPELLRGSVQKKVRDIKKQARKISDTQLLSRCERLALFNETLASTLEQANGVRKIADYEPDKPVIFHRDKRFQLNGISINDAHAWHALVDEWSRDFLIVMRSVE
jgi:hypothetical protein